MEVEGGRAYLFGGDGFVLCGVWVGSLAVSKIYLGAHQNMGDVGHVVVHLWVPLFAQGGEKREEGTLEGASPDRRGEKEGSKC